MLSLPSPFPERDFSFFHRGEEGSLLGSNVASSESYVVVGANGYNEFKGLVQVISTINGSIHHIANIKAPLNDIENSAFSIYGKIMNFGFSTGIDEVTDSIIIGAIGYAMHIGKAFIYVSNINSASINDRWHLHYTLNSPVQQMGHGFGYAVCMYDNFAVVGTSASIVYIYRLQNDVWDLVWTLSAAHDQASAFGSSLSLYNRTMVIGDHGGGSKGGRVYVYTINEDDSGVIAVELETIFTENIKFESNSNFFGKSIQLHGDCLLIGAPHQLLDGQVNLRKAEIPPQQGTAYIYERINSSWINTANLSSLVDDHSLFGSSVSIRNDMAVIGAYAYGNNSGCAFWYRKDPESTQWILVNSFPPPLYQNDSGFGFSVGVGANSIAIGAYTQDQLSGAIYITSVPTYGTPTVQPTTIEDVLIQKMFNAHSSAVTLTALSWLVLCVLFVLVMIAILVVAICCCCPNVITMAGRKTDGKKDFEQHHNLNGISYADAAIIQLIAMVDDSAEGMPPVSDPWLGMSEVEETDFIVQGAGLVTNSASHAQSTQGASPAAPNNDDLHLVHNHFVLSDPLESAHLHLPPKNRKTSSALQKAVAVFRSGMKRTLPSTDSSYSIQERQLDNTIFSYSNSGSPPRRPRPVPSGNPATLSAGERTPGIDGRDLPITTSALDLLEDIQKPDHVSPSAFRSKTTVKRLSNVSVSPFSSFSTHHSQSSDTSNVSTLSLSSTSSIGGLSASSDLPDSTLPFDRSNYRPSIAEPTFKSNPSPTPPPMYQVSRATAHGGFALKDKNLPPLPSPTHSRRSDHTSPIRSPTLSPLKSPTIDKANRPSALEIGLFSDYTKTKNLYQAFRKEVKAQMNFQVDNISDDGSNCSSRSLWPDDCDDGSSVGSPSPAPFRSIDQFDFLTPTKSGGARLSPLSKSPPISQPDVNFYMTSPEEREIHTQLRVETKARYLEFKAHVGSLLSETSSPNSSVCKVRDRKGWKARTPSTASNTPLTPRSSESPVSVILSNSFYHIESDDDIIMVENEMRSALIQQQYPPTSDEVPMQSNDLRFTEYREQYPPTQSSIPEEQNMLRQRQRQRLQLLQRANGEGAAPSAAETASSMADANDSNLERDNSLRSRAAKANYKRFREKVGADNSSKN